MICPSIPWEEPKHMEAGSHYRRWRRRADKTNLRYRQSKQKKVAAGSDELILRKWDWLFQPLYFIHCIALHFCFYSHKNSGQGIRVEYSPNRILCISSWKLSYYKKLVRGLKGMSYEERMRTLGLCDLGKGVWEKTSLLLNNDLKREVLVSDL